MAGDTKSAPGSCWLVGRARAQEEAQGTGRSPPAGKLRRRRPPSSKSLWKDACCGSRQRLLSCLRLLLLLLYLPVSGSRRPSAKKGANRATKLAELLLCCSRATNLCHKIRPSALIAGRVSNSSFDSCARGDQETMRRTWKAGTGSTRKVNK